MPQPSNAFDLREELSRELRTCGGRLISLGDQIPEQHTFLGIRSFERVSFVVALPEPNNPGGFAEKFGAQAAIAGESLEYQVLSASEISGFLEEG